MTTSKPEPVYAVRGPEGTSYSYSKTLCEAKEKARVLAKTYPGKTYTVTLLVFKVRADGLVEESFEEG